MVLDVPAMRAYIENSGLKQKYIAEKTAIPEATLSNILNEKRKCEVGEYATLCNLLGVKIGSFIVKKATE